MNLLRAFRAATLAALGLLAVSPASLAGSEADALWPSIREDVFGGREIAEAKGRFELYAPAQAADAALVPVSIHLPADVARAAKSLTLIIDRNPSPVAAVFTFGEAYRDSPAIGERVLSTRVRVDSFSKLRAVLETADGELMMAAKFVAGAGGCSATPSKDPDAALAELGKVRVRSTASAVHDPRWREGVIMVRHPNFTGLQMNAKTGAFVPARFVDRLVVSRGGAMLLTMNGGISISEDPNLRFTFAAEEGEPLSVAARDTEGVTFSGTEGEPGS